MLSCLHFFFINDAATTEIYTLSLHDALPISHREVRQLRRGQPHPLAVKVRPERPAGVRGLETDHGDLFRGDRKSTRLNSSHTVISYAVFCLKKKKKHNNKTDK